MVKIKHYNIPVFIPELACPHRCVFCNQEKISGTQKVPSPQDVAGIIEQHLATMDTDNAEIEVAFFGGSFTGIPVELQKQYLEAAYPYVKDGRIKGLRCSTRPDYIDDERLQLVAEYGMKCIELGAQSMNDAVLKKAGRGHTAEATRKAAQLIKQHGMELGLQLMIGLPGSVEEDVLATAKEYVALGADNTRIYPTLVISDTPMEKLYLRGDYSPISMEEAVRVAARLTLLFNENGVKILRTGLHPSEDLTGGGGFVAGPFHASFSELVQTAIWSDLLLNASTEKDSIQIATSPRQINYAIGYKSANRNALKAKFDKVKFTTDSSLKAYEFRVSHY